MNLVKQGCPAHSCVFAVQCYELLSRSRDLPVAGPELDFRAKVNGSLASEVLGQDAALQEINHIWSKLSRVITFEKDCIQSPAGLVRSARLICRYERMLTKQLHAHIRACAAPEKKNENSVRRSL